MLVEAWLERAAAAAPDRPAIETRRETRTYAELLELARAGARELGALGLAPGERLAIALGPGLPFAEALHSCLLLGAVAVPLDMRLPEAERRAIAASCMLTLSEPLALDPSAVAFRHPRPRHHDLSAVAAVIHSSGTTSTPKPIELTYGNLLWSALGSAVALGLDPDERWLCTLPVAHVGGLSILVRSVIYATTAVLHERFDTEAVLDALQTRPITLVSLVATTLDRLLDAGLHRPPTLRCALTGGGPVPGALIARARAAGIPVATTYGLTEACSQVTTLPVAGIAEEHGLQPAGEGGIAGGGDQSGGEADQTGGDADQTGGEADQTGLPARPRAGAREAPSRVTAGPPLFCTRLRIAEDGEILVAGPTVAPASIGPDGWLHTGDLGWIDELGRLLVTGRKSDTIVTGGENVSPIEVEAVLQTHPGVLEAAVIGREHPEWGEAVTAIVVHAEGAAPVEADLRAHCARSLASFKIPKAFLMTTDPLPRTHSGKLSRRGLARLGDRHAVGDDRHAVGDPA